MSNLSQNQAPNQTKPKNTPIVVLLSILIIVVLGVGGYFIISDINKNNSSNSSQINSTNNSAPQNNSNTNTPPTPDSTNNTTPTDSDNLEAGITYAEIRGDDFYIEAQTNGAIEGTCVISITPTNGSQSHSDTSDLDVHNKVSTCDEDFSLRKLSSGQHLVRVIINAYDGRSTTLEQYVDL